MTVSSTTSRINYAGDGVTTVFAFPYYFLADADLVLSLYDPITGATTPLVLNTDYIVTGAGVPSGGSITMAVAPIVGKNLDIYRDPPAIQPLHIVENDPLPAAELEKELDRLTMLAQRNSDQAGRALVLPDNFAGVFNTTLPSVFTPNKVLMTDNLGQSVIEGPTATDIINAQANAAAAAASATASAGSATASQTSNLAAQAAATAAQAAAAATIWQKVVFKTFSDSPIAIDHVTDRGALYVIDTSGGNVVINLPATSTMTVPPPFILGVKKESGDGNTVTVNAHAGDTIDGGASTIITSAQAGTSLNATPSANEWIGATFGAVAGNVTKDTFSGDNSTVAFTLSVAPGSINNTNVFISGVYQEKSTYSLSTATITFSTAPPTGANNIEVMTGSNISIGTPADATVTRAKAAAGLFIAPTVTALTSGSGLTYTTPAGALYLKIKMVGGGGGGACGLGPSGGGAGNDGGDTIFGTTLLVANGGKGATRTGGSQAAGGLGTLNSPAIGKVFRGSKGSCATVFQFNSIVPGLPGGCSPFGGQGGGGGTGTGDTGGTAQTNSGSGGGGGGQGGTDGSGGSGGSGGFIECIIPSPASSYTYTIGGGGSGGSGTNGGGGGGSGIILIEEYYQ
jgi:hypothetical protein